MHKLAVNHVKITWFILTSAVVLLACTFPLSDKMASTWTDEFKLPKLLICCELFVTLLRSNKTRAAFFCNESSPLSAI